ncbi:MULTISPECIES: carbohydrate ABC transporter permease [Caloramator]|uniref:Possible alpha-xyloside ABC transporter, permease component n=2 Tax=Caloramator TaxID=44258 RepID=I7KVH0_9CLOT|nr:MULTISPECIES: carbohydrate ABC transporter permease [Caloramator]MDO6356056.1 carbohydrate ABC transporter permease [Caloramator sp. CAR-1]CCJ34019.1 Possible alpha-xyloside ABC transporter, permease component [Caloramator australicus RC3]
MDKRNIIKWLIYAALTLLAAACLLPFAMMIINSTRSNTEIVRGFTLIPGKSLIENYKNMMYHMDVSDGIFKGIWLGYKNSFIIASSVTILSAYFSALTAYGFYAYEFKGKKLLFIIILIMMMIPSQLSLLGFFELNKALKTLDSYIPLIVPSIATPFTVFFMRQYLISSMHPAVIEAARIDGAGELSIFHKIILPMMLPAIATMSIFTFIGAWNSYIVPLVVIFSPEKYPLPVLMGYLKGGKVAENLGSMYLAISMSVAPIIIAFMFLSKYIISSISAGSVKE